MIEIACVDYAGPVEEDLTSAVCGAVVYPEWFPAGVESCYVFCQPGYSPFVGFHLWSGGRDRGIAGKA
jgi:hypothetical protein